jgi:hypothetical protein
MQETLNIQLWTKNLSKYSYYHNVFQIWYLNQINNQAATLVSFTVPIMHLFLVPLEYQFLFLVLIGLLLSLYNNKTMFITLILASFSLILMLDFNFVHIKFYFLLFILLKQIRIEDLPKPKSFGNAIKIYRYHSTNELPIINFISIIYVLITLLLIISNDFEVRYYSLIILSSLAIFNAFNVLILVNYLNPKLGMFTRYAVGGSALTTGLLMSTATLHVVSTTPGFDIPDVLPVKVYQKMYFGYTISMQELRVHALLKHYDLEVPLTKDLSFDYEEGKKIINDQCSEHTYPVFKQGLLLPSHTIKKFTPFRLKNG